MITAKSPRTRYIAVLVLGVVIGFSVITYFFHKSVYNFVRKDYFLNAIFFPVDPHQREKITRTAIEKSDPALCLQIESEQCGELGWCDRRDVCLRDVAKATKNPLACTLLSTIDGIGKPYYIDVNSGECLSSNNNRITVCTDLPTPRENGDSVYPSFSEYRHLRFMGSLFTAARCGTDRLKQVAGGENADYKLGSSITLQVAPNPQLRSVLESIGYQCKGSICKDWQLWATVKVQDLLRLMPYASDILKDDCLNCG